MPELLYVDSGDPNSGCWAFTANPSPHTPLSSIPGPKFLITYSEDYFLHSPGAVLYIIHIKMPVHMN